MISLIGFSSLFLSLVSNLVVIITFKFSKTLTINKVFYSALYSGTFFIVLSFLSLVWAFISSDFSNFTVFQNSHSSKPLLYKITGTWGNHEGSMLLWLMIMCFCNMFFSFNKILEINLKKLTIFFQSLLFILFCLFVITTSNPFLVNSLNVNEGLGLNPILQDPALAIHPPVLYIGYIGYSLVLSLAIAGLILDKIDLLWIKATKTWALFCWSMLTGGIALGSYWAYYELGWGGWWFWDPVENLSLMPWIAGLALVHSLTIVHQEQLLKQWVVFLSILCFSLSIIGTFLIRSGILTSVHSFATDPSRGIFILILFLVITGFSFIIFILKSKESSGRLNLLFINKTSALIINNIVMLIACFTVLLGTIYPIIIEVLTDKRISVGAPYYNSVVLPILLPGFLLMSIAPALSWQTNKLNKAKYFFYTLVFVSIFSLFITYLTNFYIWGFIGTTLGLWIIAASLLSIFNNYKASNKISLHNNALFAHIGIGIVILGITFSSVFQIESNHSIKINETINIGKYSLKLNKIEIVEKSNYQELIGNFNLYKQGKLLSSIKPGQRYYHVPKTITTEAGIYHNWLQDFYLIINKQKENIWSIKMYQNPLVSFIWIGALFMIISGIIGMIKK